MSYDPSMGWFRKKPSEPKEVSESKAPGNGDGRVRQKINLEIKEDDEPATKNQVSYLKRLGIKVGGSMTKYQATQLISSYLFAEAILQDFYDIEKPKREAVNVITQFIISDMELVDLAMRYDKDEVEELEEEPLFERITSYIKKVQE